jgi:hypothetical protein
MNLVKNGSIAVRLNDENSSFFKAGKGLRQGKPLCPFLFNLVIAVFTRMMGKEARKGYIQCSMTQIYPKGVTNL